MSFDILEFCTQGMDDRHIIFTEDGERKVARIGARLPRVSSEIIQYLDRYRSDLPFILVRHEGNLCCFEKSKCRFLRVGVLDELERNAFLRNWRS